MQLPHVGHDPVLIREILNLLAIRSGITVIDGTLGRGGHALPIGSALGPTGTLIGMGVYPRNLQFARDRLKPLTCTVRLFEANFAQVIDVWDEIGEIPIDAMLVDLGVS